MKIRKRMQGSLTVEATLILPLFFFVVFGFLYFFQVFKLQIKIQDSLTEIGQEASRYGYVYEYLTKDGATEASSEEQGTGSTGEVIKQTLCKLVDGSFYKVRFKELMENDKSLQVVKGGVEQISFMGSSFMTENAQIQVVASYDVQIPVPFFSYFSIPIVQKVKTRGFVGVTLKNDTEGNQAEEENQEEVVYATRKGTAYHKSTDCTYLSPKITSISAEALQTKRSKSGAIYYACEACCEGTSPQSNYFITAYGNRYHTSKLCTKIDRTILTLKKSEVGTRKPCSKCYP